MLSFRTRKTTTRVIIHGGHEDIPDANPVPILRVRGREMGLLEVGYHYVISGTGEVWCCRPASAIGAHTPGHNHDSLGVYLAGKATGPEQVAALRHILRAFRGLPILGKSEVIRFRNKPTGPFFSMNELRAKLGTVP